MSDLLTLARQNPTFDFLLPLRSYLENEDITEVMINANGSVWIDSVSAGLKQTETVMPASQIETIIHRIASRINYEIDKDTPSLSAMIPELKIRMQGQIAPSAPGGAFLTMRKQARGIFRLEDYVRNGTMTEKQAEYLSACVKERKNILIGGGVGSGKTTMLNALLYEVGKSNHRCVIIEDEVELQFDEDLNYIRLSTSKPERYSGRRAVYDSLRLRPDRIIYGEVRDGATALELLKGWNTGQAGGMATIHADGMIEMLDRMYELLMEVSPNPPLNLIKRSIDLCVYISKREGARRIEPFFLVEKPSSERWEGRQISI